MPGAPKEVVYINGGEIYKAPTAYELMQNYAPDDSLDPIFPFVKFAGKRYFCTTEFKSHFGGGDGASLAEFDLCPAVTLWLALGAPTTDERNNFDLFFAATSSSVLQSVATYYGLPYPVTAEVSEVIDNAPDTICQWNAGGTPIVTASVKFVDGKPTLLKLYTYPKRFGSWDVWMYGASYHDGGKCFERGAIYQKHTGGADMPGAQMRGQNSFRKAEVIYSERADGVHTSYAFVDNGDPVLFWQGNEIDASGRVLRVKRFESARWVRKAIARLNAGPDFADRNLCPAVPYWLGRAWYDGSQEEELFFAVTGGSAMLDAVAAYHGLSAPYSAEQKAILDTKPELYRARHYDLLGQGLGSYVNVVVGSVTFVNGQAKRLLLYTFLRQWEFEQPIVLPSFS